MWRACKNILPTKDRLLARGVGSGDYCALCVQSETSGHILWGCQYAKEVWSGTKIKLPWLQDPLNDFVDIVWETMNSHPQVDWTMFAVTAWSIWNNRNSVIHEGKCKGIGVLIRAVADYVDKIKQGKQPQMGQPSKITRPWSPPRQDWYKINTDGVVFRESGCSGSGVVIRNEEGQIMGAMSKRWDLPLGALEIEAMAVEDGVQFAWDLGLKRIIIESDSQIVVNAICDQSVVPSSIQHVIEGIGVNLRCFDAWMVSHVCRESNSAAHILARNAKFVIDRVIWVEDTPPIVSAQVQHDVICMNSVSV